MADAKKKPEEAAAGTEEKAKEKGGKKAVLIAVIIVVDLLLMAGMAYFIVKKLKGEPPKMDIEKVKEEEEKKKRESVTRMGHTLDKPLTLVVNIEGPDGPHYLKCAVQLEWDAHEGEGGGGGHGGGGGNHPEIQKRLPKITDIILNILSSQSMTELLKPSGKQRIRESIMAEVNAILPPPGHGEEGAEKGKQSEDGHGEGPGEHGAAGHAAGGLVRNVYFTEFLVQ